VLYPRLVDRVEPQEILAEDHVVRFPQARIHDDLGVQPRTLEIIRDAMRADVEDPEGTGRESRINGFKVCAKTGTAQIMKGKEVVDHTTWFASYAPYESPRYVVV